MMGNRKKNNKQERNGEERSNIKDKKKSLKKNLMGDLSQETTAKQQKLKHLEEELAEDERGRISIKPEPILKGKPKKKKKAEKEFKNKKNQKKVQDEYEKDYVWVRKELEGYAPLHSLDIWNKIKTSIRYMDEKKGKTARKNAEAARIQNMKKIKIESEMKKKITDYTEDILENRALTQELEITCNPEHVEILKTVISQEYFTMFDISLVEINPNLKRYGVNPPILLNINKKGVKL